MEVREYTCQECGYTKAPTTHVGCGGNIVRKDGKWQCDACGVEPLEETVCSRCGETVVESNIDIVEMELEE